MAKLYFKYGAMNSGKSIDLIRTAYNYEEMGYKTVILKSIIDTKGSDKLQSRIGLERKVDILLPKDISILPLIKNKINKKLACILVDEAQFLTAKQVDDLFIITKFYNIPVICYGLRNNFKMHSFEGSRRLLEIADVLEEIKTLCHCGHIARFSARTVDGKFQTIGEEVIIDGKGKKVEYVPLCGRCYLEKVKRLKLDSFL